MIRPIYSSRVHPCPRHFVVWAGVCPLVVCQFGAAGQTSAPAKSGEKSATFWHQHGTIHAIAFDPSGRYLVVAGRREGTMSLGTLRLYDVQSGRRLDELPTPELKFSVKDSRSGQERVPFVQPRGTYRSVCWSPRGDRVAATGESGTLDLYALTPTARLKSVDYVGRGLLASLIDDREAAARAALVYSRSGKTVTEVGRTAIARWNLARHDRSTIARIDATLLCVSRDGRKAAVVSGDRKVSVWDLLEGSVVKTLSLESLPDAVALSGDGSILACAVPKQALREIENRNNADSTIVLYKSQAGVRSSALSGHNDVVLSLAFSGDGQRLVSGSYDRTVRVWSLKDGSCQVLGPFDREVEATCDSTGKLVAVIVGRAAIECWKTEPAGRPQHLWQRGWCFEH